MKVRHLIKVQPRGVLLTELRVFFVRPRCSQAGSPSGDPAVGERRPLMAVLTSRHLINAPLDHLNVISGPAFDYFVIDPK
jgi:hypothetical protein